MEHDAFVEAMREYYRRRLGEVGDLYVCPLCYRWLGEDKDKEAAKERQRGADE